VEETPQKTTSNSKETTGGGTMKYSEQLGVQSSREDETAK
jgi:hypothetical protein